jgi:hypothetical protein
MKFYWIDEPALFGVMLLPLTVIAYAVIALATRLTSVLAVSIASRRGIPLRRAVVRRALGFHAVHLVPAAFLPAAVLGGPFALQLLPLVLVAYLVFAQLVAWAARWRVPRRPGAPGRTYNVVRLLAALVMALIVGQYFVLFDSPYFDRIAVPLSRRPQYPYGAAAGAALALTYVAVTALVAVKRMMYVNVTNEPDAHAAPAAAAVSGGPGRWQ